MILNDRIILGWKGPQEIRVQPPTQSWYKVEVQSGCSKPCPAEVYLLEWRLPPLLSASSSAWSASGGIFFSLFHIVRILLAIACVHCLSFLAVHLRRVCLCVLPNHTPGSWGSWSDSPSPGSPNPGISGFSCTSHASGLQPSVVICWTYFSFQVFFLYWEAQKWPHKCSKEQNNHFPQPAGYTLADAVQYTGSFHFYDDALLTFPTNCLPGSPNLFLRGCFLVGRFPTFTASQCKTSHLVVLNFVRFYSMKAI